MANLEGTLARHRTLVLVAGGGLLILGGIAAFDWLANRGKAQATAAAATGSTSGNGATGSATTPAYSNSETYINSFADNSVHTTDSNNSPVTSNTYTPPAALTTPAPTHVATPPPAPTPAPVATQPAPPAPAAPTSAGTLHPTSTPARVYTVQPGDSLWAIAEHQYGIGSDWTRIYDANRGTVGANPNLIYPGERLSIPNLN